MPKWRAKALVKMLDEDRKTFLDQQLQTEKTYFNRDLKNTKYKALFKPEEGASS